MFKFLLYLGFFGAFISPLGMLSYFCVFSLKLKKVKLSLFELLFLVYLFSLLLYSLAVSLDSFYVISIFRFYFGFFVFYVYFKTGKEIDFKLIFLVLLIIIPLEAVLINSVISPHSMPNFPSEAAVSHFNPGGYQRPYSFAGNSSVASSILVVLLSMLSFSPLFSLLAFINVIVFSSGSGFISYALLFFLKNVKFYIFTSFFTVILVGMFFSNIIDFVDSLGIKVNSAYILYLIEFKIEQISYQFDGFTIGHLFFGNIDSLTDGYGGDFGWMYFVLSHGFLSFFILIAFVLSKVTLRTIIPILIILISTFHYPVMFFLPGQILIGYLMAKKHQYIVSKV
ncbi:hypothetical protein [Shewanella sp.]|uniref:hypothetical protein n=1 Tax=Shewanella sp. TaxID=50422 RepID=UPI0040539331